MLIALIQIYTAIDQICIALDQIYNLHSLRQIYNLRSLISNLYSLRPNVYIIIFIALYRPNVTRRWQNFLVSEQNFQIYDKLSKFRANFLDFIQKLFEQNINLTLPRLDLNLKYVRSPGSKNVYFKGKKMEYKIYVN